MAAAKHDLIVIGGGPAGEKGAAQAAYFGKRVALVETAPASWAGRSQVPAFRLKRCARRRSI